MSLLSDFNQLINEHGSSTILKERIELFKDRIVILEKDNIALKVENKQLKADNQSLKADMNNYQRNEDDSRNNAFDKNKCFHKNSKNINKEEIRILKVLFSKDGILLEELSDLLGADEQFLLFHLLELKEKQFVVSVQIPMVGDYWSLEQNGRKFLIQNNLTS